MSLLVARQPFNPTSPGGTDMFEIVRQDLQRCLRVNQTGPKNVSAYLREMFHPGTQAILTHRFGVWADGLRFPPLRYLLRIVHFPVAYVLAWRVETTGAPWTSR